MQKRRCREVKGGHQLSRRESTARARARAHLICLETDILAERTATMSLADAFFPRVRGIVTAITAPWSVILQAQKEKSPVRIDELIDHSCLSVLYDVSMAGEKADA